MTIVIGIELRIFDQIVGSVIFEPQNGNTPPPPKCWNFEDDGVPNGSTGNVAAGGVLILFMKYDVFRQNVDFIKEWGISSLNYLLTMSI